MHMHKYNLWDEKCFSELYFGAKMLKLLGFFVFDCHFYCMQFQ